MDIYRGASARPRPTLREADPAPDPMEERINRIMSAMAEERQAEVITDLASLEKRLLDQVSGINEVCRD